jgi:hypothetical protein
MDVFDRLAKRWMAEGAFPYGGSDIVSIRQYETRYGIVFPPDFHEYLLQINGMSRDREDIVYGDAIGFTFFDLQRIVSAAHYYGSDTTQIVQEWLTSVDGGNRILLFASFDFHLFCYAIDCRQQEPTYGSVLYVNGVSSCIIAPSFVEFLNLYLDNRDAIAVER